MSLINEDIENTVVVIGEETNGGIFWIGTGFFVNKKSTIHTGSYMYLVSNRHVFENKKRIFIRAVLKNDQIKELPVDLYDSNNVSLVRYHQDINVDIGVVLLSGKYIDDNLKKIKGFDIDEQAFTSEQYLDNGGFEGSAVFMLGFTMGLIDNDTTTPLCRKGCIARFKQKEIERIKSFMLDLQNFPGNSGSPIISCPEIVSLTGTKCVSVANLIGIAHKYVQYKDELLSRQTKEVVEIRSENSGIALAHPVEYIKEIIEKDMSIRGLK